MFLILTIFEEGFHLHSNGSYDYVANPLHICINLHMHIYILNRHHLPYYLSFRIFCYSWLFFLK